MDEALRATHIMPVAFELSRVGDLKEEVFGPVLHIVRWRDDLAALVEEINALGYGLTLGIHTRIDDRAAGSRTGLVNPTPIGVGIRQFVIPEGATGFFVFRPASARVSGCR